MNYRFGYATNSLHYDNLCCIYRSVAMLSLSESVRSETSFIQGNKEPRYSVGLRKTSAPASSKWRVQEAMELPFDIEPQSVTVDCGAEEVARRIDHDLFKRSVAAIFDDVGAIADCYTSCNLHYRVSLFKSECGGTVVEVQKRNGCSFEFAKQRTAILNASMGCSPKEAPKPFGTQRSMPIPDFIRKNLPPISDSIFEDSIQRHIGPHHNVREKMVSLEELISMTNIEKSSPFTASKVANLILLGTDSSLREVLINDIRNCFSDGESKMIRKAALQILFNCVISLKDDMGLEKVIDSCPWFRCVLAPALLEDINMCGCPHFTCLSFGTLSVLAQHSICIANSIKDSKHKLNDALRWGEDYGSARHAKLLESTNSIRHLMGQ